MPIKFVPASPEELARRGVGAEKPAPKAPAKGRAPKKPKE